MNQPNRFDQKKEGIAALVTDKHHMHKGNI